MDIKWHSSDETHMQVREKNGVTFLAYPAFENLPEIIHCFSTRLGGVSEGIFSSMNLSFTRGDNENAVKENYRRLGAAVVFAPEDVVSSDQTHTTNVRLVGAEDRGNGITRPRTFHDTDGMITNVPGVVLATYYADCVPLYFVDPVHHAIGLSHSGWRGTVGKIGKVTIEKMHQEFGSDPAELLTAIGPSICQDCYEVSEDVILEFQNAFNEKYWNRLFYKKDNGKYQLNPTALFSWKQESRRNTFPCLESAPAAIRIFSFPIVPPTANAATWLPSLEFAGKKKNNTRKMIKKNRIEDQSHQLRPLSFF